MEGEIIPMEEIKRLVRSILDIGFTISLGTVDGSGVWVCDLTYVSDSDLDIYWMSYTNVRHSEAVLKNPDVSGSITLSYNVGREVIGLQIGGVAEKLQGEPAPEIVEKYAIKAGGVPPSKKQDGSIYPDASWYRLKPKKIELLYAPLYGFDKKVLEL